VGFNKVLTEKQKSGVVVDSPARYFVATRIRTEDLLQELAELSESLGKIVAALPSRPPTEMDVWTVYAGTEKVVAILKLRLGVERPGVFSELPKAQRSVDLLPIALERMTHGTGEIKEKRLLDGLNDLRVARDHLRAYLSEERKARMRTKRRAAVSSTSS
jgi:hypothetical protein